MGLMRLLFFVVIGYVIYKVAQGFLKSRKSEETPLPPKGEETRRDPVCGLYVSEEDAVIGRVEGERIYFCSMECLEKYRDQLEQKEATAKSINQ